MLSRKWILKKFAAAYENKNNFRNLNSKFPKAERLTSKLKKKKMFN